MIDERIAEMIRKQNEQGGIDVSKLKPGTRVVVKTLNSTYEITVIEGNFVWVKGGKFFREPEQCYFPGSTWGGSMLKQYWIGYDMRMELPKPPHVITTSRVQAATIYGEEWSFEMWKD